jgi:hypothetical protein
MGQHFLKHTSRKSGVTTASLTRQNDPPAHLCGRHEPHHRAYRMAEQGQYLHQPVFRWNSNEEGSPRAAAASTAAGNARVKPTVVPSRSVEPDWSLERDHGEAHDLKQSPYRKSRRRERVRLAGARTLPDTGGGEPRTPTRGPSIEHGARPSTHRGPGVTSCPAVVAEVIVRHPLDPVRLIPHRRRRQPMRSARDTMIPSGPRT